MKNKSDYFILPVFLTIINLILVFSIVYNSSLPDIELRARRNLLSNYLNSKEKVVFEEIRPIAYLNMNDERKIKEDTIDPVLIVYSVPVINMELGETFKYPEYSATDNIDGNITNRVIMNSDLNEKVPGSYTIKYSVCDSNDNCSNTDIIVNIFNKNPYIVVSINKQKLKYYEYGKVVLESDIVTGKNDWTPLGTFKVRHKSRNIILRGPDYASFVQYWIDFKSGKFGFHDASWRSRFGGKIYIYNGSHGCVNMPTSAVKKLFNLVEIGTPVYIRRN